MVTAVSVRISCVEPSAIILGLILSASPLAAQEPGACPDVAVPVLSGSVLDEASQVPLPSAIVVAEWGDSDVSQAEVRTEADGSYRLCRLPTGVPVTLRAFFGERATQPVTAASRARPSPTTSTFRRRRARKPRSRRDPARARAGSRAESWMPGAKSRSRKP